MNCVFAYTQDPQDYRPSRYQMLRNSIKSGDTIKLTVLLVFFLFMFGVYTITVNISSTQWYYYSKAVKAQSRADFQYNITKLNVMTMQSDLRNNISFVKENQKDYIKELIIVK